jgi:hypothetical protein
LGNVKLVVIYPQPKDVGGFAKISQTEHVPLAAAKLAGKTKSGLPVALVDATRGSDQEKAIKASGQAWLTEK